MTAERLRAEGLDASSWGNGPGHVYAEHRHGYDKVLGVDVARAVAPARRVEALRAQSFGGHRLAPIRLPTR